MSNSYQFFLPVRTALCILIACASLTACSGSNQIVLDPSSNVHDAIEAATGPLEDLNIRRQEIPTILQKAAANPYAHKAKVRCPDIKSELAELDTVLGEDVKISPITLASADDSNIADIELPDKASVVDDAGHLAHDAVMDVIRSHTSVIPFRGIVRRITGAEHHQHKLEEAYQAGKLRRAYLKGLAETHFGEKCLAKPVVIEAKAEATH